MLSKYFQEKSFLKSSVDVLKYQYLFFILNFIGQLILIRLLTPEDFGIIAVALAITTILNLIFSLNISFSYIYLDNSNSLYSTALISSLLNWLVTFLITMIILYFFQDSYSQNTLVFILLISFFKIFDFIRVVMLADLEKNYQFSRSALITGLGATLSLVIAILIASTEEYKNYSLISREILTSLLVFSLTVIMTNQKVKIDQFNISEFKALLNYSYKTIFARGAEAIYFKIPILLSEKIFGMGTTGLLHQVIYLSQLVNSILAPFTQKVAFVFYTKQTKKSNFKLNNIINIIIIFITLPFALSFIYFSEEILYILWGEKWLSASGLLSYMAIFVITFPMYHNMKSLFFGQAKQSTVTYSLIIASLIYLISFYQLDDKIILSISFSLSMFICVIIMYSFFLIGNNK